MNIGEASDTATVVRALFLLSCTVKGATLDPSVVEAAARLTARAAKALGVSPATITDPLR